MTPSSNDPAEARKRRKEIIQSQRSENELIANGGTAAVANGATVASAVSDGVEDKSDAVGVEEGEPSVAETADANGTGAEKKPPKKRKMASGDAAARKMSKKNLEAEDAKNKKTQIRYDPDVPMNKDQLAAWRREARRVRNRESAAASRQRIRNRISELEDEVGEWKKKYSTAIQRLEALEKHLAANGTGENGEDTSVEQHLPEQLQEQQPVLEEPSEKPVAVAGVPADTI
jgi:hypothetical protein